MDETKIAELLNAPMVDWAELSSRPDGSFAVTEELQDTERRAALLATQYARLSAYLSRRMAGGQHADAVKAQNNVARRVRQALGYTYADDSIHF